MLTPNFTPFPILTTDRLVLRRIKPEDAKELLFLRSDDITMQYIARPRLRSIAESIEFIGRFNEQEDTGIAINWAITLKENDVMIGVISLMRFDNENHRAELGYILHPDRHRKGIMSEAICEVLRYGFHEQRFHAIAANIDPENEASEAVLKKTGFVQEGYFRESYHFEGKFLDSAVFSILTPLREKA